MPILPNGNLRAYDLAAHGAQRNFQRISRHRSRVQRYLIQTLAEAPFDVRINLSISDRLQLLLNDRKLSATISSSTMQRMRFRIGKSGCFEYKCRESPGLR